MDYKEMLNVLIMILNWLIPVLLTGSAWVSLEAFIRRITPDSFEGPLLSFLNLLRSQVLKNKATAKRELEDVLMQKVKGVVLSLRQADHLTNDQKKVAAMLSVKQILDTNDNKKASDYIEGALAAIKLEAQQKAFVVTQRSAKG